MKTLKEQVEEIKAGKGTKTYKKEALIKLGLRPYEISLIMAELPKVVRENIYPAFQEFGFDSERFDSVCRDVACYSKFAFLNNGKLKLIGTYYEHKGAYYSNLRFNNNMIHDNRLNVVNM